MLQKITNKYLLFYKTNIKRRLSIRAFSLQLGLLLLPVNAFAQSTDYLTTFVYNACTYASGNIARAVGVLVIIVLGYKTLKGTFDWHYLVAIIVSLGLIIGGAYYGKTVLLGGV